MRRMVLGAGISPLLNKLQSSGEAPSPTVSPVAQWSAASGYTGPALSGGTPTDNGAYLTNERNVGSGYTGALPLANGFYGIAVFRTTTTELEEGWYPYFFTVRDVEAFGTNDPPNAAFRITPTGHTTIRTHNEASGDVFDNTGRPTIGLNEWAYSEGWWFGSEMGVRSSLDSGDTTVATFAPWGATSRIAFGSDNGNVQDWGLYITPYDFALIRVYDTMPDAAQRASLRAEASALIATLPSPLAPYYDSGTILIHHDTDGATPPGGPATAFTNHGGGGSLFDATVSGTALPISGEWMQASGSVGYPQIATPADLVGVRLMWVMQPTSSTGTYRFFGRNDTNASYIRTINGTSLQMWSNRTGSGVSVTIGSFSESTAARLFELEIIGTTAELFVNGVSAGSNTIPWAAFIVDRLTQGNTSLQAFEGNMGDILGVVTGEADTAAAISAARAYLNDRYSLGLTL